MSNFNAPPTDRPINMTGFFKEYPAVDEYSSYVQNGPPIFVRYEADRQPNTIITMHNSIEYQGFNSQQYPHNPFMNLHIKQESFALTVLPSQYYQYQNPQSPAATSTSPDLKTTTTSDEQDVGKIRARRIRTVFTQEQLNVLEKAFKVCQYITLVERRDLAESLDLTEERIATWFKNRRCKQKRLDANNKRAMMLQPVTYSPNFNAGYSQFGIVDGYDRLAAYLCRTGQFDST